MKGKCWGIFFYFYHGVLWIVIWLGLDFEMVYYQSDLYDSYIDLNCLFYCFTVLDEFLRVLLILS